MSTPVDDIPRLVDRLRKGFNSGRTRPKSWRKEQLEQLCVMLEENSPALAEAIQKDLGRNTFFSELAELKAVVKEAKQAITSLDEWLRPEARSVPMPEKLFSSAKVVPEPYGVVLNIAPFNFPVSLMFKPMIGAIAAGNCVVFKPSEVSANTNKVIGRIVPRYMDPECFVCIQGAVAETTKLLEQKFDKIMYTGSTTVGRVVMAAAAKHLTPVLLELGGKSPCYVDKSCNLPVSVRRICFGKFMNSGQVCVAPDYVLVHQDIKDAFVNEVQKVVKEFYGDSAQKSPDYSRMINERHVRRVESILKGNNGTKLLGGDVDASDLYVSPTVFVDPPDDAPVMQDEIFGPILPIIAVSGVEEAVKKINARPKALVCYVFSEDSGTAQKVIDNTSSGGLAVNETIQQITVPTLPFGGVGDSGMGAYNGKTSFDAFSHYKSVLVKTTKGESGVIFPPYTDDKKKKIAFALNLKAPKWLVPLLGVVAVGLLAWAANAVDMPARLSAAFAAALDPRRLQ